MIFWAGGFQPGGAQGDGADQGRGLGEEAELAAALRNLTLNLGVQDSHESPLETKYGQQSQFDTTVRDALTGRMGAIVRKAGPLARKDLNNIAPRLGLAWNLPPKMVFRVSLRLVHQDIFATDRNSMFQEYLATANLPPPMGDPQVCLLPVAGAGADYSRCGEGRVGAVCGDELQWAAGALVGSEHAAAVRDELVGRAAVELLE